MKTTSHLLTAAALGLLLSTAAVAADPKDDLAAVMKAQNDAPAYRAKVATVSDANPAMNMTITMERVKPNQLHVTTQGGPMAAEVYSDGNKTLIKQGAGAFQEAPPQVAAMMTQNSQEAMMQKAMQSATNVKVSGHDTVNGTPATVYSYDADMMGMQSSNKLWVSDKDHRPLKSESDVHGNVAAAGDAGQNISVKVTSTFDYDPSIKVVMPTK